MRKQRGGAGVAILVLIALLAGAAYYWFVYRPERALGGPEAAEQAVEASADEAPGQEAATDDSAEPKLHERIKTHYGKKLQDRVKDLPQ
jgi:hypothetical protein